MGIFSGDFVQMGVQAFVAALVGVLSGAFPAAMGLLGGGREGPKALSLLSHLASALFYAGLFAKAGSEMGSALYGAVAVGWAFIAAVAIEAAVRQRLP